MDSKSFGKNINFNIIRCVAIIFVICIHSLGLVNDVLPIEKGIGQAHIINALMGIVYSGVPLFVMLSGALLLGKDEPIKTFFQKRLARLLYPFLLWSVVVYVILYWQDGGRSTVRYIEQLVLKVTTVGVHGIYWYIYMLIGIYILTPPIRVILRYGGQSMLKYLLAVLWVIEIIGSYAPEVDIIQRMTFDNCIWVFYFMMGYYISLQKGLLQKHWRIVYLTFVVFLCSHICLRLFVKNNTFLDMVLYINLFALLLSAKYGSEFKAVTEISRMSYGIYLTHFMIISALLKLNVFQKMPLLIEPFCMMLTVLIINVVILLLLEKIRMRRYIM